MIIYQPISIMQEYDAKEIEANALYAGFIDIKIKNRFTRFKNKFLNKKL